MALMEGDHVHHSANQQPASHLAALYLSIALGKSKKTANWNNKIDFSLHFFSFFVNAYMRGNKFKSQLAILTLDSSTVLIHRCEYTRLQLTSILSLLPPTSAIVSVVGNASNFATLVVGTSRFMSWVCRRRLADFKRGFESIFSN